ncbi:hypothetical protein HDV00_000584 [Rhizophlyctis rosea]|nr:hypothetical protein HDV00_000584 [Rhizophlyctis rosea]
MGMLRPKAKPKEGRWGSSGGKIGKKGTWQFDEEEPHGKKDTEWSRVKEEKSGWGTLGGGETISGISQRRAF